MKGCPLACAWCSNPESQKTRPEIMFYKEKCLGCQACLGACPSAALLQEAFPRTPAACLGCGRCVEVCYAEARHLVGRRIAVADVLKVIRSDRTFYEQSGGGITVGGGEPLLQHRFVADLLAGCRAEGLNTALETCGFSPWERLESVLRYVNQLLFDIKHMDPARHRELTGRENSLILENARKAATRVEEMAIRMPLIPGCNNDEGNLGALGRFVTEELPGVSRIDLMPYHSTGQSKSARLFREYSLAGVAPLTKSEVLAAQRILESFGLDVHIS